MLLYHFLPDEHALSNVKDRRLKISFADQVNDLFEIMPFDFGNNKEGGKLRRKWRKSIESHSKTSGFISFCESWHVPTMWAHYANNHQGVCLGFEVGGINETSVRATKVKYVDSLKILDADLLQNDESYKIEMFEYASRTKSEHWEHEEEWRIFCKLDDVEQQEKASTPNKLFFLQLNDSLRLKKVIFGHRSTLTTEIIQNIINSDEKIDFLTARPSFRNFEMVEQKLKSLQK